MCRNCRTEEGENVEHWLLRCTGMGRGEGEVDNDNEEKVGVAGYGG